MSSAKPVPPRMRGIGRDLAIYLPARVLPMAISFGGLVIFTRLLNPADVGRFNLSMSILLPAATIFSDGAAAALCRFYSEYQVRGDAAAFASVFRSLVRLITLAGAAGAMVVLAVFTASWGFSFAAAAALFFFSQCLYGLCLPLLSSGFDAAGVMVFEATRAGARFGIALAILLAFRVGSEALVWGSALATAGAAALLVGRVWEQIGVHKRVAPAGIGDPHLRRFLCYGGLMTASLVGAQLLMQVDRYVIEWYLGTAALGIYGANYQLATGLSAIVTSSLTMAVFPAIYRYWADRQLEEMGQTLSRVLEPLASAAFAVVALAHLLAGPVLSRLVGPEFRSGFVIIAPVLAAQAIWQGAMLVQMVLEVHERTKMIVLATLLGAVLSALLNIILVPAWGFTAAAYVAVVVSSVYCLAIGHLAQRMMPWWAGTHGILMNCIYAGAALVTALCAVAGDGVVAALARAAIFTFLYGARLSWRWRVGAKGGSS